MGFPPDVSEWALFESGRCCCLCNRFRGSKIELHHIVAKADGGDDTYENCIPLCFDCHAEVRAYDPKHPKGKKFSAAELMAHRDRWYQRVKAPREVLNHNSPKVVTLQQLFDEEPDFRIFQKIKAGELTPINKTTGQVIPCPPDHHEYMHTNLQKVDDLSWKMVQIGSLGRWLERPGSLDELQVLTSTWDSESQKRLGSLLGDAIQENHMNAQQSKGPTLQQGQVGTSEVSPATPAEELDALTIRYNAQLKARNYIHHQYRIFRDAAQIDLISGALKQWKKELESELERERGEGEALRAAILSDDPKLEKWKYLLLPQNSEAADRLKEYLAESIYQVPQQSEQE